MKKVFFDCEFTGLQKDTDLISIGFVTNNDEMFYAEFTDYNLGKAKDEDNKKWLKENVIHNLTLKDSEDRFFAKKLKGNSWINDKIPTSIKILASKEEVSYFLIKWLKRIKDDGGIEFVSDCMHYDFVLLLDLLSPKGALYLDKELNVCPAGLDINQELAKVFNVDLYHAFDMNRLKLSGLQTLKEHNCLDDAKMIQAIYNKYLV